MKAKTSNHDQGRFISMMSPCMPDHNVGKRLMMKRMIKCKKVNNIKLRINTNNKTTMSNRSPNISKCNYYNRMKILLLVSKLVRLTNNDK